MAITLPTEGGVDLPFKIEGRPLARHGSVSRRREVAVDHAGVLQRALDPGHARPRLRRIATAPARRRSSWSTRRSRRNTGPSADPIGQRDHRSARDSDPSSRIPTARSSASSATPGTTGSTPSRRRSSTCRSAQVSDASRGSQQRDSAAWIVKTSATAVSLTASIQQEFLAVDGQLPVAQVRSMADRCRRRSRSRTSTCCCSRSSAPSRCCSRRSASTG